MAMQICNRGEKQCKNTHSLSLMHILQASSKKMKAGTALPPGQLLLLPPDERHRRQPPWRSRRFRSMPASSSPGWRRRRSRERYACPLRRRPPSRSSPRSRRAQPHPRPALTSPLCVDCHPRARSAAQMQMQMPTLVGDRPCST
jgi:hypothetical protein